MVAARTLGKLLGGLAGGWLVGQFFAFFTANIAIAKVTVFVNQQLGSSLAATICGVAAEDATYYAIILLMLWAVRVSRCGIEAKKHFSRLTWMAIMVGLADTAFRLVLIYICLKHYPVQRVVFAVSSAADVFYGLVLVAVGLKSRPLLSERCI
jgi:hypothetical protein